MDAITKRATINFILTILNSNNEYLINSIY